MNFASNARFPADQEKAEPPATDGNQRSPVDSEQQRVKSGIC
jgi:hypothetical protein